MFTFSNILTIQFLILCLTLLSFGDGAAMDSPVGENSENSFPSQGHPKSLELFLNTKAQPTYPQQKLVFKGLALKGTHDKFLAHTFRGKYKLAREEFLGFSINLMNDACQVHKEMIAYVIQVYNHSLQVVDIVLNLTETFQKKQPQELTMLLPYFQAIFPPPASMTPPLPVSLGSKMISEEVNYLKSQLRNTIDGPFHIFFIHEKTKQILTHTQVERVGVSPSMNKCTYPTLTDTYPVLLPLEDGFSFVSSVAGHVYQHVRNYFFPLDDEMDFEE